MYIPIECNRHDQERQVHAEEGSYGTSRTFASQYASTPETIRTWRRKISRRAPKTNAEFPMNTREPRPLRSVSSHEHSEELLSTPAPSAPS